MGKCKTKAIQADLSIFTHIPAYSGIFRHIFRNLAYLKLEAYSEPWYIQNSGIFRARDIFRILGFRTLGYSEPEAYSEPCQTSTMEHFDKQLTANYFRNISFSCPLVHEISMIFFNAGLIFNPEVFIQCKNVWGPGSRGQGP